MKWPTTVRLTWLIIRQHHTRGRAVVPTIIISVCGRGHKYYFYTTIVPTLKCSVVQLHSWFCHSRLLFYFVSIWTPYGRFYQLLHSVWHWVTAHPIMLITWDPPPQTPAQPCQVSVQQRVQCKSVTRAPVRLSDKYSQWSFLQIHFTAQYCSCALHVHQKQISGTHSINSLQSSEH